MKTVARVGAVLSSMCFLVAGMVVLGIASGAGRDAPIITVLGLCLLGVAFFLGPALWLAGERFRGRGGQEMT